MGDFLFKNIGTDTVNPADSKNIKKLVRFSFRIIRFGNFPLIFEIWGGALMRGCWTLKIIFLVCVILMDIFI